MQFTDYKKYSAPVYTYFLTSASSVLLLSSSAYECHAPQVATHKSHGEWIAFPC